MNKVLSLACGFAFLFALGCGDKAPAPAPKVTNDPGAGQPQKPVKKNSNTVTEPEVTR